MDIKTCKNCQHYDSFFGTCDLYYEEIYVGDGDFEERPMSIRNINGAECEYKQKDK